MKRTVFFIQILLLLTAGSVFGADEYVEARCGLSPNFNRTFWFKGTGTKSWHGALAESWWDDQQGYYPPNANDVAAIDNPLPATCVVASDAECLALYIGDWPANSLSQGGGNVPQTATLDVNDGNLMVVQDVMIGMRDTTLPSDYAIGDFNIISGTVTVGCDLYIGREGIGYLNMRGGTLDVNGTIWCPGWELPPFGPGPFGSQTYEYGTGYLYLLGGTITADDLMIYDEDGGITYIYICDGTLILNGDKTAKIDDFVSEGKINACGGAGNIEFDYNVRNPGKTTVTAVFDPNRAMYPDPENYEGDVSPTTDLSWTAGINVNDVNGHDVYFGTSFDDVNDANNTPGVWPEFKGNQDSTTYDPCAGELDLDTVYYWRIDEVNSPTMWKGNVWRFTTKDPPQPCCPDPAHRLISIPIEKILKWTAIIAADSHNVYIGTSFDDVNESNTPTATTANPLYKPPEHFLFDQTYYWRVEDVNTVTATTWKGPVWRFKTFPYKDVDDMDNFITWTAAGGASWAKVTDAPLNDTKALKLEYDNTSSPWDSNVTRSFHYTSVTNRRDWVSGGVEIFQIRFHGEQDNDVEDLYVTLKDFDGNTATVLYSDSNHIVKQEHELWREWSIDIEEFNDAGINIADIRYFTLGLGDGASPGGTGTVYFDDIALFRPMCVNQDGNADLNNDCVVDINDMELFADGWLKAPYDVNINLGTYDMNIGLILWYKFDHEGDDWTAIDSSGSGHTGSLGYDNWESVDCVDGNCIYFLPPPDQMWITVPSAAAPNDLGGHSTVALWIKNAGVYTGEAVPFDEIGSQLFRAGPSGQGNLQVHLPYNGYFEYVCGWDTDHAWQDMAIWGEDGYTNFEHPLDQWVHYAFVKDATEGVMRIYQNGKIVAEEYDTTGLLIPDVDPYNPSPGWFTIGASPGTGTGGYYVGLMDDFRLYDRALSQEEIMELAGVDSIHQPVVSAAELTGDGKVNFLDYAVVAAEWLEDPLLWPY